MRISFFIIVFIFLLSSCIYEKGKKENTHDLTAKVITLKDGDSFVVLDSNKAQIEVRLLGIDAPELHQPHGKKAKLFLSELIKGKQIGIDYSSKDKYGRILGDVYLDSMFINLELVAAGYAWHFTRFSDDDELSEAQELARQHNKGLWKDTDPIPPWEWRKQKSR